LFHLRHAGRVHDLGTDREFREFHRTRGLSDDRGLGRRFGNNRGLSLKKA
jgi:hypothetical protein